MRPSRIVLTLVLFLACCRTAAVAQKPIHVSEKKLEYVSKPGENSTLVFYKGKPFTGISENNRKEEGITVREAAEFKDGTLLNSRFLLLSAAGDTTGYGYQDDSTNFYLALYENGNFRELSYSYGALWTTYEFQYYPDGNLREKVRLENERQYIEEWDENGKLIASDNDSTVFRLYDNDSIESFGTYDENRSLVSMNTYFSDGALKSTKRYRDGVPHGYWMVKNPLRDTAEVISYVNGKKQGRHIIYAKTGLRDTVENYADDILEGEQLVYYPDGKLRIRSHYRAGMLHGKYEHYDWVTGTVIIQEGMYECGQRQGNWMNYTIEGKSAGSTFYSVNPSDPPCDLKD